MKNAINPKRASLIGALLSFSMIAAAIFIQLKFSLEPCPLCITQRILFIVTPPLFCDRLSLGHREVLQVVLVLVRSVNFIVLAPRSVPLFLLPAQLPDAVKACDVLPGLERSVAG